MVSRSISISVVCKKDNHYHHKRLPYSMKCQITIFFQQQNQVLKPTCISSRVLMAVRKCSFDLLQFTSFCKASELSVNWKICPIIIWSSVLQIFPNDMKNITLEDYVLHPAPLSSPWTSDFSDKYMSVDQSISFILNLLWRMFWYLSVIFCLRLKRYLEDSRVNLLVLAVEDVLDKLDIVRPHSHLEAAGTMEPYKSKDL